MRISHPRAGVTAVMVLAALAVSACGSGSSSAGTSTAAATLNPATVASPSTARFVARVNHLCARLNRREAAVPFPVNPAQQARYRAMALRREHDTVRSFDAIRPPPQMAPADAEVKGYLDQGVRLSEQLRTEMARHQEAQLRRTQLEDLRLSRRAQVSMGEMGMWTCAADVEPERFVGSSAAEQLIAGMDQICAPAVAADWNVGTDEAVAADEARSGAISKRAARARLASDLAYAARTSQQAGSRLGELQAPLGQERFLRDLVATLGQYARVVDGAALTVNGGRPLDAQGFAEAVDAPARQGAIDAVELKATECEQL